MKPKRFLATVRTFRKRLSPRRHKAGLYATMERGARSEIRKLREENPFPFGSSATALYEAGLRAERHQREKNRIIGRKKKT